MKDARRCVTSYPVQAGVVVKSPAGDTRDKCSVPASGRSPGQGNSILTLVVLSGKFHGQRSLVCYSPWGCKELDMTEHAHTHTHTHTHTHIHTSHLLEHIETH